MTGKPRRPFQEKPPKSIRHFAAFDVAAVRFTGSTRLSPSTARVSPAAPPVPGLGASASPHSPPLSSSRNASPSRRRPYATSITGRQNAPEQPGQFIGSAQNFTGCGSANTSAGNFSSSTTQIPDPRRIVCVSAFVSPLPPIE